MDIGENLRFNRTIQWQLLRQTFAIHLVARRQLPGSTATGRNEPLLGDRHELLERIIAGLAKELDRSRRLTEPNTTRQVVNDAAPTRSRAARGEGAKVLVVALDCRSSPLPSEPPPNLRSPRQSVS